MNAHIFIDAENIPPHIGFRAIEKFGREYLIKKIDIIGKLETISHRYRALTDEPFRVQNCFYGKNEADTWLCVEIARTVFEEQEVDTIIILSNDRDFLPAIKLAADYKRKVLFVSNGLGHRNLTNFLKDLQVNLALVKLIDYRDELNIVEEDGKPKKKRSLSELMKNAAPILPDPEETKLSKFYSRLNVSVKKYFQKRENRVKFIFVKHGDSLHETIFVDGMTKGLFLETLRELRVIGRNYTSTKIIFDSWLKLFKEKVYLYTEEELDDISSDDIFYKLQGIYDSAWDYFFEHRRDIKTIFVKNEKGELCEIPFVEGIHLSVFATMLRDKKILKKNYSALKFVKENYLKVTDNRVYFMTEEEISDADKPKETKSGFDLLSAESCNYLRANEENIKFIFIKNFGILHEVPFVNGIELPMFARILHELKIVPKGIAATKCVLASGLKINKNLVYLYNEEEILEQLAKKDFSSMSG